MRARMVRKQQAARDVFSYMFCDRGEVRATAASFADALGRLGMTLTITAATHLMKKLTRSKDKESLNAADFVAFISQPEYVVSCPAHVLLRVPVLGIWRIRSVWRCLTLAVARRRCDSAEEALLRAKVLEAAAKGHSLNAERVLGDMDKSDTARLSRSQFTRGLRQLKLNMSDQEADRVAQRYVSGRLQYCAPRGG